MRGGLVDADARSIERACRIGASRHVSTNRIMSKKRGLFACHPSLRLFVVSHLILSSTLDCTSAHATLRGLRSSVLPQATAVPSQREHDDQSEVEVFLVAPTAAGTAETDEHPSPMGHGPWPASLEFGIIDQAPKRQCVRTCPNS